MFSGNSFNAQPQAPASLDRQRLKDVEPAPTAGR
jgi:hypothetical protein